VLFRSHLRNALQWTNTDKQDIVVATVQVARGPDAGYQDINAEEVFTSYEQMLFTRVIALAEKEGKHVELLVVPSSDAFQGIARTAAQLRSSEIVAGRSSIMDPDELAHRIGDAWEETPDRPAYPVRLRVVSPEGEVSDYYLGAHAPDLTPEDIERIHELWITITCDVPSGTLHHRDVVALAVRRLEEDLSGQEREEVLQELTRLLEQRGGDRGQG
jgi:hypothetical protein